MSIPHVIKQLDSYSVLIVSKYFESPQDYINAICVCKKFKETTEKLRFNPIRVATKKLFPLMETQYFYSRKDKKIPGIKRFEAWYEVTWVEYKILLKKGIQCHHIRYSSKHRRNNEEIPDVITVLDDFCFSDSCIKSITFPTRITSIQRFCFSYCTNLTCVELPNTITSLKHGCFHYCLSLASIHIPTSIQLIETECFKICSSLKTVIIPNSVTSIGPSCFYSCISLQSITLPSSIDNLKKSTFEKCSSLTNIILPNTVTSIDDSCFCHCERLVLISLPPSIKQIGDGSFAHCYNLTTVEGIDNVTKGNGCFSYCSKYKEPNTSYYSYCDVV
ncbi:Leucine rich repeat protein [Entamoeba marina]